MSFHVGQLVVCVDDAPWPLPPPPIGRWDGNLSGLRRGTVYTIRDLENRVPYDGCVRLIEIVRSVSHYGFESAFDQRRFRPVNDAKLEVFRAALAPTPRKRVDA